MYAVYLFVEKSTQKVIYVGSSARPAARMKEHVAMLEGRKDRMQKIHEYMISNGLKLYKDVAIVWIDCADSMEEMHDLEAQYYFKYQDTVLNERPAEIRYGKYNPKRRRVQCLNDGKVFEDITECAQYYNKGRTTINKVVCGVTDYTYVNGKRYYFKLVDETCNDYSERKYIQADGSGGHTEMCEDIV